MKSVTKLWMALLLAPISVVSMNAGAQTLSVVEGPSNCPVSLHVGHPAGLHATERQAIRADDQTAPSIPSFDLEITAANPAQQGIVSLQITVHGLRAGAPFPEQLNRVIDGPDFEQTVTVAMDVKGASQGTRQISLQQFRSVSTVDLESVTYADGSSWRASAGERCSVNLDLFRLLAAEAR